MGIQEEYWDRVEGKAVLAVHGVPAFAHLPGRASFEAISFYAEGCRLALTTNNNTDELVVIFEEAESISQPNPPIVPILDEIVGREFGWIWRAVNSHGYADMLIMAFGHPLDGTNSSMAGASISPQFGFLVETSVIHVQRIVPLGV